jgi:23S rRNA pseudouridine2604 synthase
VTARRTPLPSGQSGSGRESLRGGDLNHAGNASQADAPERLSKRMATLGLCSRREADEWIARGWVKVNGVVVQELGSKVPPSLDASAITVSSAARGQQRARVTVLINKPIGYVSGQAEDGYEPAAVLFMPQNRWQQDAAPLSFSREQQQSLAPAGRLDIDSTGLLVLTQDGRIARQLIGEDSDIDKEYLVRVALPGVSVNVESRFAREDLRLLNHGLSLDGERLKPALVEWQNPEQLRFVLRQGKKRQIRRMCELVGLKVVGLKRVRIGRVRLGNLPLGQWRYLDAHEAF